VQLAERTLALSPNSSPARIALGVVRWNDNEAASAAKEIALGLRAGPANGDAHDYYGRILLECGRPEDANRPGCVMALAIEPRLVQASSEMTRALALLVDGTKAWEQLGSPPEDLARANTFGRCACDFSDGSEASRTVMTTRESNSWRRVNSKPKPSSSRCSTPSKILGKRLRSRRFSRSSETRTTFSEGALFSRSSFASFGACSAITPQR